MKIIEFMGPDSSVVVPIQGDGGRERVIETLAREMAITEGVDEIELVAQAGSTLAGVTMRPVSFSEGLNPHRVLEEARSALGGTLTCDILHVHHPAYLRAAEFISARKIVLTHHGSIEHPENFRADGVTFVSAFLREWMIRGRSLPGSTQFKDIHNPVPQQARTTPWLPSGPLGFMGVLDKRVKRVDIALCLAKRLGVPLFLAGPCDPTFLRERVLPELEGESRYLGEIGGDRRQWLFETVSCMVCPNEPPEAFCLVAAEAMSIGTPVLASIGGALPEVVEDGVGGFICATLDDYVDAYQRLHVLSREACVSSVARRFAPSVIAQSYVAFFRSVLAAGRS